MKSIKYMSVLIICFVISACNNDLDLNQAKWADSAITSYTYQLETNALPLPVPSAKMDVTVVDNVVTTATVVVVEGFINFPITGEVLKVIPTISTQFLAMRPLSLSNTFEATYDETFGYPTSYSVNIDLPFTPDIDESVDGQYFHILNFTEI